MGVHDGHRKRLRANFIENSLTGFNDINALELLLSFAIPRKDTNELAHILLEKFGSLKEVMLASHEELLEVPGVGENVAVLLKLVPQIYKKASLSDANAQTKCSNYNYLADYLRPRFIDERDEVLYMVCLDNLNYVIKCIELSRGSANYVAINIRRVVEVALSSRACKVALAHNHPRGPVMPSIEDDHVTKRLRDALKMVDINLVDHLIFTGGDYFSYEKYDRWRCLT